MKKLAVILMTFLSVCGSSFSADVAVSGKLTTWAGVNSNATDFNNDSSDSVGYLYVNGEINTTVTLADNVKVYLELELNDKVSGGASMNSATDKTVEVDEANVEISKFLMEDLTLKIGHQYFEYTLRGNGRAMVFNDDFTAFKGTYKFSKGFLDVFYGKYFESLKSVNTSSDQDAYGLHFEWNFNENIHTIFYANNMTMDNAGAEHSNYTTLGAGVDYFLINKKLELFLEVAYQFGALNKSVDQSGLGLDAGARWNFGELGSIKGLWFELNVGYRSGEDKDVSKSTAFYNGMSSKTGALIAESNYNDDSPMYYGYASKSYLAIRGEAKADWNAKFTSEMIIAYFDNTTEDGDPYGYEVDVVNTYTYSDNLFFSIYLAAFVPDKNLVIGGVAVGDDTVFSAVLKTVVCF